MGLPHHPDEQTVTIIHPVNEPVLFHVDRPLDLEPKTLGLRFCINPFGNINPRFGQTLGNCVRVVDKVHEILGDAAFAFLVALELADRNIPARTVCQLLFEIKHVFHKVPLHHI